ncbi:MAG TPA: GH3 auxin-responsive promoter family protein [Candidatus Nanoarchaeia archaeon]|nr:GH3 auxin-responsive promoter family protein [Candidatus Nanoarchaeia archaeon]
MSLITSIAQIARKIQYVLEFNRALHNPEEAQKKKLSRILNDNKNTEFGKCFSFSDINSIGDYQKRVPIQSYESLKRYILKEISGQGNVLTNGQCIMFGTTSGTTGKPKLIPITRAYIKDYKERWQIWEYFACKDHPSIFNGKIFTMVSPKIEGYTESHIPFGSISGMMNQTQPTIIKHFYAIPYQIYTIKDYESKYYTILRLSLEQNVTLLITANPSTVLLLCEKAQEHREEIISDIRAGTLSSKYDIPGEIRESLSLKPDIQRADELSKIERKYFIPKNYWKDLALIGCWKGGPLALYLRRFQHFFGKIPVRDIGLMATEGATTIPTQDKGSGGIAAVTTSFVELMPLEEKGKKNPKCIMPYEARKGKSYYVVLTTSAGLYRYFTNDIIKVVGYRHKTPILEFLHKGEHITSITGEKLTEIQVLKAIQKASKETNVHVENFTACMHFANVPYYDFLIEPRTYVKESKLVRLVRKIDENLKILNIEYRGKRNSKRLGHPVLKLVRKGSYNNIRKAHCKKRGHDSQLKIPLLSPRTDFEKRVKIEKEIRIR